MYFASTGSYRPPSGCRVSLSFFKKPFDYTDSYWHVYGFEYSKQQGFFKGSWYFNQWSFLRASVRVSHHRGREDNGVVQTESEELTLTLWIHIGSNRFYLDGMVWNFNLHVSLGFVICTASSIIPQIPLNMVQPTGRSIIAVDTNLSYGSTIALDGWHLLFTYIYEQSSGRLHSDPW